MRAYVFVGPTLPLARARELLDAVYLPPARQGEVFRLVQLREPKVIGLIDGHFNQVPAVWHKEILWAMSAGVHVFGAASMGALRAAELSAFGMQGVGRVFEAYRDGVLPPYGGDAFEDDDEVAVTHAPGEAGYLASSEAMVNMRCTLADAADAGIISRKTRDQLVMLAKQTFYPERRYPELLRKAAEADVAPTELEGLRAWLPSGRRDQKRLDAERLLQAVAEHLRQEPAPMRAAFSFQHTVQWETATTALSPPPRTEPEVLNELRLTPEAYKQTRRRALRRLLAFDERQSAAPLDDLLRTAAGATPANDLDRLLDQNHGRRETIDALWRNETRLQQLRAELEALPLHLLERHMLAELRRSGDYPQLQQRAGQKRKRLAALAERPMAADLSGLQTLQLQDWYFTQRLRQTMPQDLDHHLERLGFADTTAFNEALLAEYLFLEGEHHVASAG